jgi:hypothetical protein
MLKICLKFTNYQLRTGQILPNKMFWPADWDPKQQFWDPRYEKLGPESENRWDPKRQSWAPIVFYPFRFNFQEIQFFFSFRICCPFRIRKWPFLSVFRLFYRFTKCIIDFTIVGIRRKKKDIYGLIVYFPFNLCVWLLCK